MQNTLAACGNEPCDGCCAIFPYPCNIALAMKGHGIAIKGHWHNLAVSEELLHRLSLA